MIKARKLKDIELKEISYVDKAATKKRFLFFKQEGKPKTGSLSKKTKINAAIESDGTASGTKIKMNGDDLGKLRDFNFSFYGIEKDAAVNCSYSKIVKSSDGFSRTETFYLSKGEIKMNKEIAKLLKKYFDEEEIDFEKIAKMDDETVKSVNSALEVAIQYKADFPEDLEKAVGILAKQAGLRCDYSVKKQDEDEDEDEDEGKDAVKKAGAKLSKDTLAKIQAAVKALEALQAILPDEAKKSSEENPELKKSIEELTKSITQLEGKNDKEELVKMVKNLSERIKTVEESTGVKKGVEGQDDDDDDDDNVDTESKKLWPSLSTRKI